MFIQYFNFLFYKKERVMFLSKTKGALMVSMVLLALIELVGFQTGDMLAIATSIGKILIFVFVFYLIKNHFNIESDKEKEELKILYEEIEKDSMTGLFDKKALHSWYNKKRDYIESANKKLSIIIIEIDDYKKIKENEILETSDAVVCEFADLINNNTRRMIDFVVRLDESKFAIMCFEKEENALLIAKRVSGKINEKEWSHNKKIKHSMAVSEIDIKNDFKEELGVAEEVLLCAKEKISNISTRKEEISAA